MYRYHTAGNIGGQLNLAVWRLGKRPSNLSAIYACACACAHIIYTELPPNLNPPASTMDTQATSHKCSASLLLNAKGLHPTTSVVTISPPRTRRRPMLGDSPCLAPNFHWQWLNAQKGGRNCERNCRIPCISPPLRFVLSLRLQKGSVFVGHYGTCTKLSIDLLTSSTCMRFSSNQLHTNPLFIHTPPIS